MAGQWRRRSHVALLALRGIPTSLEFVPSNRLLNKAANAFCAWLTVSLEADCDCAWLLWLVSDGIKQFLDERTQMLAAISHDLRTSLTRLRLEAEELPESETKNRLIFDMSEMERMISATLTFAGDELKSEPQQRVDVAALLISLCDSFSDHGQPADYNGPNHAYLLCQPVAMKRAFDNLIGNAIKYGFRASVTLTLENGSVLVSITDAGPGISPENVELAFRPFRRLETSRNRETGGVGLGLPIARDIIRAHGGEISLRNRPEGGLEVTVRLPTWRQIPEPTLSAAK